MEIYWGDGWLGEGKEKEEGREEALATSLAQVREEEEKKEGKCNKINGFSN